MPSMRAAGLGHAPAVGSERGVGSAGTKRQISERARTADLGRLLKIRTVSSAPKWPRRSGHPTGRARRRAGKLGTPWSRARALRPSQNVRTLRRRRNQGPRSPPCHRTPTEWRVWSFSSYSWVSGRALSGPIQCTIRRARPLGRGRHRRSSDPRQNSRSAPKRRRASQARESTGAFTNKGI